MLFHFFPLCLIFVDYLGFPMIHSTIDYESLFSIEKDILYIQTIAMKRFDKKMRGRSYMSGDI
jgi:hypothetical protein